ncbi:tail fiber protein [Jatrophihabitans sp.]|uniref:phage tail protein n=1 Tax=Jatrophihabitans sp. TaxID=1932789 RepID=UPI0030C76E8A|nr:Phage tail collar domain protein [Jatrophihabitans sp.]
MSDPFVGEIRMFAGNFAPQGWAFCNGQLIAISQNTALFSILGTNYGGNGSSTFGLPDLRGRVPVHWQQGPGLSTYNVGQAGGAESVTLTAQQLPAHSHTVAVNPRRGTLTEPEGNVLAATVGSSYAPSPTAGYAMNPSAISGGGGGQAHSILQPYLAVSFIIAMQGIYPARN